ncbi:MAG: hypothetical protein ACE15C_06540 [Phycisphaerae bacterium]
MTDIYQGKVFGLFDPLRVEDGRDAIVVRGTTFGLKVSKASGQLVSAQVEGTEFLAPGSALPSPYVGVFPADEKGARTTGGADRPRFGHELACEIHPRLFSGGLTAAHRHDATDRPAESVEVALAQDDRVVIRSRGRYGDTPLRWEVEFDIDVDGLTKATVRAATEEPLLLRWHCYSHAMIAPGPVEFLVPWADTAMAQVTGFGPLPARSVRGVPAGDLVFGAGLNPYFHLGNTITGIEFSKQDFDDRHAGYRDSGTVLEDGTKVDFDTVLTEDGRELRPADSRGWRRHFTQLYRRPQGYELEEFDIRNTTLAMNPDRPRERTFWFQLTPCRHAREDLNSCRVVWPGPHQIRMVRWSGRMDEWAPPSDEQVRLWAQLGVNLIVGGANYFSGDYMHPTDPDGTRHFLQTAHAFGMKVIPYVTFNDFNFAAPLYQEHGAEWMNSQDIEFKCETTLMCFGAQGWREHFEKQIDWLLANFEFDGLYIDHWANTRLCNNRLHGCGGYQMRFVVEGYHDIARRARRVVARHTGGKGVMLLNSGDDIFSGVLSWFDLRLIGENIDPRKVPALTIRSSYDPDRQGIATVAYPSRFKLDESFLNFVVSHMFSVRLQVPPERIEQWQDRCPSQPWDGYKRFWDIWRSFDLNRARRISAFRSRDLARVSHPEARVTLYLRDGRVLVVIGIVKLVDLAVSAGEIDAACAGIKRAMEQAGLSTWLSQDLVTHLRPHIRPAGAASSINTVESAIREGAGKETAAQDATWDDVLELPDLKALGLNEGPHVVQDLLAHAYVNCQDIHRIPVQLHASLPRVLLIEPSRAAPRLAHFTGADAVESACRDGRLDFTVSAAEGSPLALYIDAGGAEVTPQTGFAAAVLPGGLVQVSGNVPADGRVTVQVARGKG